MNLSVPPRGFRQVGSRSRSDAAFPLTPALSPRERETAGQSLDHSKRANLADTLASIPPLPEGEGWGEGEQAALLSRPPDMSKYLCRLAGFKQVKVKESVK